MCIFQQPRWKRASHLYYICEHIDVTKKNFLVIWSIQNTMGCLVRQKVSHCWLIPWFPVSGTLACVVSPLERQKASRTKHRLPDFSFKPPPLPTLFSLLSLLPLSKDHYSPFCQRLGAIQDFSLSHTTSNSNYCQLDLQNIPRFLLFSHFHCTTQLGSQTQFHCVLAGGVPPHQQILRHQQCVNSIMTLSRDSIRFHRLRAQSYKIAPSAHILQMPDASPGYVHFWTTGPQIGDSNDPLQFRMPITSPGRHLYFWMTGYKSEVPTTPSLGLIDLLE